jgi:CRISPR-associated protein Cmr4
VYQKSYGIIETMAPLHVGASAGEENGNLNLIFRDQFTQTGIIPGSSIRGRFRADMREQHFNDDNSSKAIVDLWYGGEVEDNKTTTDIDTDIQKKSKSMTEALVKFEYASIVWIPVFCPGQPVVWVTCRRLLDRYKKLANISQTTPLAYTGSEALHTTAKSDKLGHKFLFFNLGRISIQHSRDLSAWKPQGSSIPTDSLLVVGDNDMAIIHNMALYRQSRVALESESKIAKRGAFFDVEALPEGTVLSFPMACKKINDGKSVNFADFIKEHNISAAREMYFGGLESIGFGRCQVSVSTTEIVSQAINGNNI